MTLGTEFSDLAVEEITNGELWTHDVTITYGPRRTKANPWDEAADSAAILPQTVRVAALPVERSIEEGGRKIAMWKILAPVSSVLVRPTEEDTVTIDGLRQDIISSDPIGANGVNAVYEIVTLR